MEGRGGKGVHFFGLNFFFIVERLGRGRGFREFLATNSLWDGGKGAPKHMICALRS